MKEMLKNGRMGMTRSERKVREKREEKEHKRGCKKGGKGDE